MRWLVLVLLVSLLGLLIAALGVARYIWLQRARYRLKPPAGVGAIHGKAGQSDAESEP
jgi:uncharacterized iron-regulated membrane protein